MWANLIVLTGILLGLGLYLFDDVIKSIIQSLILLPTQGDLDRFSSVVGGVLLLAFGVALFVGGLAAFLWPIKTP